MPAVTQDFATEGAAGGPKDDRTARPPLTLVASVSKQMGQVSSSVSAIVLGLLLYRPREARLSQTPAIYAKCSF